MLSAPNDLSISGVRADALFASALQRSDEPSAGQVRQATAAAVVSSRKHLLDVGHRARQHAGAI